MEKNKSESAPQMREESKKHQEFDPRNNDIDFYRILNGMESRTTVMIRNIPNKFKQMTLLNMINQ